MMTRTPWSFRVGCHRFVYLNSLCSVLYSAHEAMLRIGRINKTRSRNFGLRGKGVRPLAAQPLSTGGLRLRALQGVGCSRSSCRHLGKCGKHSRG